MQYQLTSDGLPKFESKLNTFVLEAVIGFPNRDNGGVVRGVLNPPLSFDFRDGRDDSRLFTPPLSHRRVKNGVFEFGSLNWFASSWASIGRTHFDRFHLKAVMRFVKVLPDTTAGYIGIGFHSQNPLVPFCHAVYLNRTGEVMLATPDEAAPQFGSRDDLLGRSSSRDIVHDDHHFEIHLSENGSR